jgi:hypothetical protein
VSRANRFKAEGSMLKSMSVGLVRARHRANLSLALASSLQIALLNWSTCTKWSQYAQSIRAMALAINPISIMMRAMAKEIGNRSS